ncbi:MAG: Gfo/Idh/MocA family oxidoreductase [Pseudomonadota bacterium]
MTVLRWGVLSSAKIAREKVIPAMANEPRRLVAVSSRSQTQATLIAKAHGFSRAYASHQALIDDPEVDAVYIPLPNDLHVEWAIRAVNAGKHVLCEKPMAMNLGELTPLIVAAEQQGVVVAEAFMVRHHPQWHLVRDLIAGGELGKVHAIHGVFSYYNDDPDNIRNRVETGGGALYDIGVYPIVTSRFALGQEPISVLARIRRDPRFGTDFVTSGILSFADTECTFTVSTQAAPHQSMRFFGSEATLTVPTPFIAAPDVSAAITIEDKDGARRLEVPACNQYRLQTEAFERYVAGNEQNPFPLADSVKMAEIIDALFLSAADERWVTLS